MLFLGIRQVRSFRRLVLRHARTHMHGFDIGPGESAAANMRRFMVATVNSTYLHISSLRSGVRILIIFLFMFA